MNKRQELLEKLFALVETALPTYTVKRWLAQPTTYNKPFVSIEDLASEHEDINQQSDRSLQIGINLTIPTEERSRPLEDAQKILDAIAADPTLGGLSYSTRLEATEQNWDTNGKAVADFDMVLVVKYRDELWKL